MTAPIDPNLYALLADALSQVGPEPQEPTPVTPNLPTMPPPWMRGVEAFGSGMAGMPWMRVGGFGPNMLQGFAHGFGGAMTGRLRGRAAASEAAIKDAEEKNREARSEWHAARREWLRELREASRRTQERKNKAADAASELRALPPELAPFLPGYRAGELVPPAMYREAVGPYNRRNEPKEKKEPKESEPLTVAQELEAAAAVPLVSARLWDQRADVREPLPKNPTAQQMMTPTGNRPLMYPAAAESAASYRMQAEINRSVTRYRLRVKAASKPGALDALIEEIRNDTLLDQVAREKLAAEIKAKGKREGW